MRKTPRPRPLAAVSVLGAGLVLASLGAGWPPFAAARAADDERATTEALLRELGTAGDTQALDAGPDAAGDGGAGGLGGVPLGGEAGERDFVARARRALARADELRTLGDTRRARLAESLARDWAEAARELRGAAATEARAYAARRDSLDAGAALERERALLEETVARVGRLRAQLEGAADAGAGGKERP